VNQEPSVSHTSPSGATAPEHSIEPEIDILDAAWLSAPVRRSRFRMVLLAALAVLLMFLGGVEAQKRWGSGGSASTSGRLNGATLPAEGFSGFPGGGIGTPSGTSSSSRSGTTSGTSTPAVIGTLTRIHGHTWTVKDLGGTTHTVQVTGATTLTRPLGHATGPIRTGTSVTVTGTTTGDTVAATAITIR
jgi:hypothetical protein